KDLVKLKIKDKELSLSVRIDKDIKNGAFLPYFDEKIDTLSFFLLPNSDSLLKKSLHWLHLHDLKIYQIDN
ncbi:hypothetical protein VWO34_09845, partial [Campylobacter coli]|uniref:hypothetical protein n=1 Tax=Campylobacter coli TaxID=195 RepID=UPI002E33AD86